MPCYDPRPGDEREQLICKVNDLTAMLCGLAEAMQQAVGIDTAVRTIKAVPGLFTWYKKHAIDDQERKINEQLKLRREALKKQALAKLTEDERAALGL